MSSAGRARPTLFLPVEVKVREFTPKLLIATVAAEAGWRVYVGSKAAITTAIHRTNAPGGVYFAKGGDREQVLADAKRRCQFLVVQDEEIGPGMTPDEVDHAWRSRYSPSINALADRVFAYSSEHVQMLDGIWPELADRAIVTGWPRFDLWQSGYRSADDTRARQIRDGYGDFVLFSSRFKVTTERQREVRIAAARHALEQRGGDTSDPRLADDDFGSKATERHEAFLRSIPVLRAIADDPDVPRLIIRPHPSEDPDAWRDAFSYHDKVDVVFDGDVGPWILASRVMLHTASTTALQAHHYGTPVGFLAQIGYPPDGAEDTESYRLSTRLDDTAAALAFVRSHPARPIEPKTNVDLPGPPPVATRIVAELAGLDPRPTDPVAIGPVHAAGSRVNAGYHRWKRSRWSPGRLTPAFYGTNAQPKLPGGLTAAEARAFIDTLPLRSDPTVRSVRNNLLRIEELVGSAGPRLSAASWLRSTVAC